MASVSMKTNLGPPWVLLGLPMMAVQGIFQLDGIHLSSLSGKFGPRSISLLPKQDCLSQLPDLHSPQPHLNIQGENLSPSLFDNQILDQSSFTSCII